MAAVQPFLTADRIATLQRLWADKHPWALQVQSLADYAGGAYADFGQWSLLLWLMTGDSARARQAIDRGWKVFQVDPLSRNDTRESTITWALTYRWLRDQMADAERVAWVAQLNRWADLILNKVPNKSWGTRTTDSDETVGHYFGLAAIAQCTAADNLRAAGLLNETPAPGSATPAQMRLAIAGFCTKGAGGEWIESSGYNLGTLQLLLMGATVAGIADYPEVAQFAQDAAEQMLWQLTADGKDAEQWGDEQDPHSLVLHNRVGLASILVGVTGDSSGRLRAFLGRLTAARKPSDFWINLYRALWFFDPATMTTAPDTAFGFRVAPGMGLVLYRQPNELVQSFSPAPTGVDHSPPYCTDLRWYRGGEWALDHPFGYGAGNMLANGVMFSNLPMPPVDCGYVSSSAMATGGFQTTCRAAGTFTPPGYWNAPVPFLTEWTRSTTYDGQTITIRDSFSGKDPLADGMNLDGYKGWWPIAPDLARARLGLWTVQFYCPTQPVAIVGGYRWKTAAGTVVTLTATGHEKTDVQPVTATLVGGGSFHDGQLTGYLIRFASNQLTVQIVSTLAVGAVAPPPPVVPPVVPPPPPPSPPVVPPVVPPPPPPMTWIEDARVTEIEGPSTKVDRVLYRKG